MQYKKRERERWFYLFAVLLLERILALSKIRETNIHYFFSRQFFILNQRMTRTVANVFTKNRIHLVGWNSEIVFANWIEWPKLESLKFSQGNAKQQITICASIFDLFWWYYVKQYEKKIVKRWNSLHQGNSFGCFYRARFQTIESSKLKLSIFHATLMVGLLHRFMQTKACSFRY